MSFRQARTVVTQNHRQVCEDRQLRAQGFEDIDLPGRIVNMVVTAYDVSNSHVDVIDNDGEIVGWHAVGAHDHQVIQLAVADADTAVNLIIEYHLASQRVCESG